MELHIKYMVSLRCKMLVRNELEKLGLQYESVDLGVVDIAEEITDEQREIFNNNLKNQAWSFWMIKIISWLKK